MSVSTVEFVNPFMLNVFSYPYQLDGFIFNLRVVGWYFTFLFKIVKETSSQEKISEKLTSTGIL